jgi:hypothetical protein
MLCSEECPWILPPDPVPNETLELSSLLFLDSKRLESSGGAVTWRPNGLAAQLNCVM